MHNLAKIPFHPLLFALFPTIALYAYNIHEVSSSVIWRPLLISLAGAILSLVVLRLLIRDWLKAALITSFVLLLFFTYGRVYDYLKTTPLATMNVVRHRYLIAIFTGLLFLAVWLMLKRIRNLKPATSVFNIMAIVLLLLPAFQISTYTIETSSGAQEASKWMPSTILTVSDQQADKPDVYYIILDTYTRSDVLLNDLGYDNSDFINQLEKVGFYVADCSRSNYNTTRYSLVSSLNMSFLPELYAKGAEQGISKEDIWLYIKPSLVRRNFESLGYKIVTFDTGYIWTTVDDADLYLQRGENAYGMQFISPFEQMLMDSTMLSIYNDFQLKSNRDKYFGAANPNAYYIGQQEFIFDQLPKIPEISYPTFTFAHINLPHRPYVFSPKGYLIDPAVMPGNTPEEVQFPLGYLYATEYIDAKILAIIEEILSESKTPPIIILQGDHGTPPMSILKENPNAPQPDWYDSPILNAYYLPGVKSDKLYPTISPVNSFRVVFNEYFGGKYELLPDESYQITDVTKPVPEVYPDCQK